MNKYDKNFKKNFSNELVGYQLNFISKKTKMNYFKLEFLMINFIFVVMLLIFGLQYGLQYLISPELFDLPFNKLIWPFASFAIAFLGFNLFLLVVALIVRQVKFKNEVNDEVLSESFKIFRKEWMEKNGIQQIDFTEHRPVSSIWGLSFRKKPGSIKKQLLRYKKYSKKYEYWFNYRMQRYFFFANRYAKEQRNITIFIPGENIYVRGTALKFIFLHNFLCQLNEVDPLPNQEASAHLKPSAFPKKLPNDPLSIL